MRPNQIGDPNQAGRREDPQQGLIIGTTRGSTRVRSLPHPAVNSPLPGNEKRGAINGPGLVKVDLGVYRNFRIVERLNFQFRAEAFNATEPHQRNVA